MRARPGMKSLALSLFLTLTTMATAHAVPGAAGAPAAPKPVPGVQTAPTAPGAATAQVTAAANTPGPAVERITAVPPAFSLTHQNTQAGTDALVASRLAGKVTLPTLLGTDPAGDDPWTKRRSMRDCVDRERLALPPVPTVTAWCWDSAFGDDTTREWLPQGMSTTGAADGGDGRIQNRAAVAVAWRYQPLTTNSGCQKYNDVRVSFIDHDTGQYQHVLLVEPTSAAGTDFKAIPAHAGGIVWYGNHLFVTDTAKGIRVFDINKLSKVHTQGRNVTTIGVDAGKSSACGLPYVLPQVRHYSQTGGCASATATGALCHSWLSLDKTGGKPFKLVSGEYHTVGYGGRIARYALNDFGAASQPGLLALTDNKTQIHDAYAIQGYSHVQSGLTWNDTQGGPLNFAFHSSCGTVPNIFARTWEGDTRATRTNKCTAPDPADPTRRISTGNWAAGVVQGLDRWPVRGTGTPTGTNQQVNELWGLTEGICDKPVREDEKTIDSCANLTPEESRSRRTVFAVPFGSAEVQDRH
ncbi:hypothetical protein ACFVIM_11275 [Streptomyces sp. NPDC057638]|uniref:hypothetical protein n=1 Tax=Streptomyces sp. NPDC057638 TaxID=3346190 RepID=UPI003685AC29